MVDKTAQVIGLLVDESLGELGLSSGEEASSYDREWIEDPVTFREFNNSTVFCGGRVTRLSEKQLEYIEALLGPDPKKVFTEQRNAPGPLLDELVLLLGKGSGKDTMVAMLQLYLAYLTLCMRDPAKFLTGFSGVQVQMDLVNVSYSKEQAKETFFDYFTKMLKACQWFAENFRIEESGRVVTHKGELDKPKILIKGDFVAFPNGVRAHAECSQSERLEGYNTLFWSMDEASAFKDSGRKSNAPKVYRSLKTSTRRFGRKALGAVLSYPRGEYYDFTIEQYKKSKQAGHANILGFKAYPWEVLPPGYYPDEWFPFTVPIPKDSYLRGEIAVEEDQHVTLRIPITFADDFRYDPEDSCTKFLCMPPPVAGAFFQYPARIEACVDVTLGPIFSTEQFEYEEAGQRYVGTRLIDPIAPPPTVSPRNYVVWVDSSLTDNRTALVVGRRTVASSTGELDGVVYVDQIIVWAPDEVRDVHVGLLNVEEIAVQICTILGIQKVYSDRWVPSMPESLGRRGIRHERKLLHRDDWRRLRKQIYAGLIKWYPFQLLNNELTALVDKGTKVDHPDVKGATNDVAYVICGANAILLSEEVGIVGPRPSPLLGKQGMTYTPPGVPAASPLTGPTGPVGPVGPAGAQPTFDTPRPLPITGPGRK